MTSNAQMSAGYTLLELLVVLVIMAAVTGIAVDSLPRRSDLAKLDREAARMAAFTRTALERSAATGAIVLLAANTGGQSLAYDDASLALPADVTVTTSGGPLLFFPDRSSSGGTLVIAGYGAQRTLAVEPLTGRVVN